MTVRPARPSLVALVLGAVLLTFLVPASAPAVTRSARDTWKPHAGPVFNRPIGDSVQQRRLLDRVISATDHATPGSTIRMAVFSFGDPETADALLAAYRRGVKVKLVFSGSNDYPAMKRLQAGIGDDITKSSFVVFCERSCRGTRGEMHAKYFAFSHTGAARWVTMVGSVNLTQYNAQKQWADLYVKVDDRPYWKAYRHWFAQLKRDEPVDPTFVRHHVGDTEIEMTPTDTGIETDPVADALGKIRCEVPMGEIDPDSETPDDVVRTRLDISAHAWNEDRGKTLAWQVVRLDQAGCQVRVFYGVGMGAAVKSILANNGVEISNGTHKGIYTHQKMMIVSGGYDGLPSTVRAWTGSHNWSNLALGRDDLIVTVEDQADAQEYADRFNWMWNHA
ncbi:phospholipase D-like domain-containing protein [Nocardioides sp. CN2-186]|uniref:phospholipase D-like domain-containing protein n=1 Tax=Nocardioides tweenelious TaxID=3156607 RepID=UPI0032B49B29